MHSICLGKDKGTQDNKPNSPAAASVTLETSSDLLASIQQQATVSLQAGRSQACHRLYTGVSCALKSFSFSPTEEHFLPALLGLLCSL